MLGLVERLPVPISLREIELVTAIKEGFLPDNLDRTTLQIVTNERTSIAGLSVDEEPILQSAHL